MQHVVDHLGSFYVQSPAAVATEIELASFRAWLGRQWRILPVPVQVVPYDLNLSDALQIYRQSGRLVISSASNNHPVLSWLENVQFRAVHDWHHIVTGADDSLLGEMVTYQHARSTAPQSVWWILRSEIVLQAAAFYYTGSYQPQKLVRTA